MTHGYDYAVILIGFSIITAPLISAWYEYQTVVIAISAIRNRQLRLAAIALGAASFLLFAWALMIFAILN